MRNCFRTRAKRAQTSRRSSLRSATLCFATPSDREETKQILERYPQPENVGKALVPRVNEGVWGIMTPNQQRTDVKAAAIQNQVNSAAIAVLTAVNNVKAGKDSKGVLQLLMDAVALLGRGSMDVSLLRRQLIRPSLGDYQDLDRQGVDPYHGAPFRRRLCRVHERCQEHQRRHYQNHPKNQYKNKNRQSYGKRPEYNYRDEKDKEEK